MAESTYFTPVATIEAEWGGDDCAETTREEGEGRGVWVAHPGSVVGIVEAGGSGVVGVGVAVLVIMLLLLFGVVGVVSFLLASALLLNTIASTAQLE